MGRYGKNMNGKTWVYFVMFFLSIKEGKRCDCEMNPAKFDFLFLIGKKEKRGFYALTV